jgi:glutamate dehydrogenase/leucine dehydrogenase
VDEVRERLKAIMTEEFGTVYDLMVLHEIDMPTAAHVHALNRIGRGDCLAGDTRVFTQQPR